MRFYLASNDEMSQLKRVKWVTSKELLESAVPAGVKKVRAVIARVLVVLCLDVLQTVCFCVAQMHIYSFCRFSSCVSQLQR